MITDLPLIFYAWAITALLQFLAIPWLITLTEDKFSDAGWALARPLSWLSTGLIIWFLSHLLIPANTLLGTWAVIIGIAILTIKFTRHQIALIKETLFQKRWLILFEETLFATGFFFLSLVRGYNPKILDLEKFMDAGFMASYLRAATLPAPDIWLAGETINYYSFGHFLGAVMTRIWHLPIASSYNLLLGFIMGLSLMLGFSLIANLIGSLTQKSLKPLVLGGLVGTILLNVGGNTHTIWYLISHGSWQSYWYADATRFIYNTIHEFPSYSYVVADIHAHVWNLPLVLTFLTVVLYWIKSLFAQPSHSPSLVQLKSFLNLDKIRQAVSPPPAYFLPALILGILIGTFVMTSAWDAMIYTLFMAILGILLIISFPSLTLSLVFSAIIAIPSAIITALPWLLNFTSISEGIAAVSDRSPLWQLAALWTNHLTASLSALISVIVLANRLKKRTHQATLLMISAVIFTAWILLFLPELVFVKDIYSGHPRANTMFKLTYQSFILMSLAGGWLMGMAVSKKFFHPVIRFFLALLLLAILAANLTFPFFAYPGYYGHFREYHGLNGYAWLEQDHPSDYAAIQWLQQNISGQSVILEAVGESYTTFNRVSAVTGLPTVLGWRVHEWLWRGGFDIPGQRTEEVKTMFENPLSDQAQQLYQQYQVEYIFIGDKEYEAYPNLRLEKLQSLGEEVFRQGRTHLIRRTVSQS
jgi:uncharacterized membrane protein